MPIDFSKLDKGQLAKFDKALQFLEEAKMPWSRQGAKNRDEIRAAGGLNPEDARLVSAYRAYKYGITYHPLDPASLTKSGIPAAEISRIEEERKARHDQEAMAAYDLFVRPPDQTMEPLEITAKVPDSSAPPPQSTPVMPANAAPPPQAMQATPAMLPPQPVPFDSSIPGAPSMQAGEPPMPRGVS